MQPPSPSSSRLPVLPLVQAAFRILYKERDELLRLGFVPVCVLFVTKLAQVQIAIRFAGEPELPLGVRLLFAGLSLIELVALTWLSVGWQRIVLLGPEHAPRGLGLTWARQHWLFIARVLAVAFAIGIVVGAAAALTNAFLGPPDSRDDMAVFQLVLALSVLAITAVALRLSLAFPASALGAGYGFAQSWRDTAGQTLRLFLLILCLGIPFLLATIMLALIARATGLFLWAPLTFVLIERIIATVGWVASFTALALAFRTLADTRAGKPAAKAS